MRHRPLVAAGERRDANARQCVNDAVVARTAEEGCEDVGDATAAVGAEPCWWPSTALALAATAAPAPEAALRKKCRLETLRPDCREPRCM